MPKKTRVLIIGAAGFIGRRILRQLELDGLEPVAVSRRARSALAGTGYECHDADATDVARIRPLMRDVDALINCVAGAPEDIVAGAEAMIAAVKDAGRPIRIVHLSSLAAYGSARGLVDESAPLRGDLGAYSAAKATADRRVTDHGAAVILRPGIVFGPGSSWWSDRIARLLVARRLGDLGSRGEGICNAVFVDDVAQAALRAVRLADENLGAYNLGSPEPLTWNHYFAQFARALGVSPVPTISGRRLAFEQRFLALPLKLAELALGSPAAARWNPVPPIRPWLTQICAHDIRLDVTRATSILGMQWTPLGVGLERTANWFRAGGRTVG